MAIRHLCPATLRRFLAMAGFNVTTALQLERHCVDELSPHACHPLKMDHVEPYLISGGVTLDCVKETTQESSLSSLWAQRGGSYRGGKSSSRSGAPCVSWSRVKAARIDWRSSAVLHQLVGTIAACRNPLGAAPAAFLFCGEECRWRKQRPGCRGMSSASLSTAFLH